MQASEKSRLRNTPFGATLGRRDTGPVPFDLIDHLRTADAAPRRPAYEIFSFQPALDGLVPASPARAPDSIAARRTRAAMPYRAIGRLTWMLLRLAACGMAGRLLAQIRRRAGHASQACVDAIGVLSLRRR